jgi:hypothetical protein
VTSTCRHLSSSTGSSISSKTGRLHPQTLTAAPSRAFLQAVLLQVAAAAAVMELRALQEQVHLQLVQHGSSSVLSTAAWGSARTPSAQQQQQQQQQQADSGNRQACTSSNSRSNTSSISGKHRHCLTTAITTMTMMITERAAAADAPATAGSILVVAAAAGQAAAATCKAIGATAT